MELQYFGANCLKLSTRTASIVVDDNLEKLGAKPVTKADDIALITNSLTPRPKDAKFIIDMPGEYEIAGIVVHGIAARAHMDQEGDHSAVIYTIQTGDVRVAILGHIFPELSDDQVEQIGEVDALIVPVGNSGYTMDGIGALKVIKKIEPPVVIPTHYADKSLKYEVPQVDLAEALKGLGMEPSETVSKYKVTPGIGGETTKLVVLETQK